MNDQPGQARKALFARLSSRDFPSKRVGLKNLIQVVIHAASTPSEDDENVSELVIYEICD